MGNPENSPPLCSSRRHFGHLFNYRYRCPNFSSTTSAPGPPKPTTTKVSQRKTWRLYFLSFVIGYPAILLESAAITHSAQLLLFVDQRVANSQHRLQQAIDLIGLAARTQKTGAQRELPVDLRGARQELVLPDQLPEQSPV
jgi:hypothetical protein